MEFWRSGQLQAFLRVCDGRTELNRTCLLPKAQRVESICYFFWDAGFNWGCFNKGHFVELRFFCLELPQLFVARLDCAPFVKYRMIHLVNECVWPSHQMAVGSSLRYSLASVAMTTLRQTLVLRQQWPPVTIL